ncbi:helix-turn-helix domain-containing protein [Halobacterium wangiae]|uniref:helix-turn-helix domain-containing protein n=1 Tax=Halobacterium wangiae TaxID=2902623 RepID=UPI001E3BC15F|nr:helix-turn-helix domain-containing protein [Halobacterium wangiae]
MSIIVEFTLSSPRLVLTEAMTSAPEVSIRVESVDGVPPEDVVTMLWATGGDLEAFDDAIRADPTVTDVALLDAFEGRRLYRYRVADEVEVQMYSSWIEVGAAQLHIGANDGEWYNRVRFPDRDALREFQARASEEDVQFTVHSIYDEPAAPDEAYLTEAQAEALELALETGYLEVPREASLSDVADELGVSEQSVSERLRRATRNLARDAVDSQS